MGTAKISEDRAAIIRIESKLREQTDVEVQANEGSD